MRLQLSKTKRFLIHWNTKREIIFKFIIINSSLFFLVASFFLGQSWFMSFMYKQYILYYNSQSFIIISAVITGIIVVCVTSIPVCLSIFTLIFVKDVSFLKKWLITLSCLWIVYFLTFLIITIQMLKIFISSTLITSLVFMIFLFLFLKVGLFLLWKELKRQISLKIFADFKKSAEEISDFSAKKSNKKSLGDNHVFKSKI